MYLFNICIVELLVVCVFVSTSAFHDQHAHRLRSRNLRVPHSGPCHALHCVRTSVCLSVTCLSRTPLTKVNENSHVIRGEVLGQ